MAEQGGVFLSGSLMRHVTIMSLTASIGLMAMFAVDFVDMVFISMLGNDALAAAVGYAGTILFFTNSISIGLSIAAGSLTARATGRGDKPVARDQATTVAVVATGVGLAVPLFAWRWLPLVLNALGARGEVASLAMSFLTIVLPGMPLIAVAMTGMAILRSYGDARRSMLATLIGGAVNAALAPLLIFGLQMGLRGAAIATDLSYLVMLTMALYPAIRIHHAFAPPSLKALRAHAGRAAVISLPIIAANIATPVGTAIVTHAVARFGTGAIAGTAVIGRLTPLAFAMIFALSGAIGPIIGQNAGAGLNERVREAFNAALLFAAIYVLLASASLLLLRYDVVALFSATGEARNLILLFCGPLALMSFFNGVIFVANASFNNLGRPIYSATINWGRHTLGTWPLVMAGSHKWGASGALIGQAVGGVIFAGIAWLLAQKTMRAPETVCIDPQDHLVHLAHLFERTK